MTLAVGALAWALTHDDRDAEAAGKGKPPVVLLMFDEFPADLLLGPNGRIDAARYPAFAELARAGYWFPNATTTFDSTTKAIPQIIDGRLPRAGGTPDYRSHRQSLYDVFGRKGYRIRRVEAATSICPPRWCPNARVGRPAILTQLQEGRRERLSRLFRSIRPTDEPTFWLAHILLPHGPYMFLPSGNQTRADWQDPIPGMNSTPGFYSSYQALHAQQRLQLQIGFVDRELGKLFARMRREGMFDRSLIVVTADHGISSEHGVRTRRNTDMRNIDELAPVPLFVKAPRQKRGRTIRSYVRTTDVAPTIADLVNARLPYRADGRSAFSRAVRTRDDRQARLQPPAARLGPRVRATPWRAAARAPAPLRPRRLGSPLHRHRPEPRADRAAGLRAAARRAEPAPGEHRARGRPALGAARLAGASDPDRRRDRRWRPRHDARPGHRRQRHRRGDRRQLPPAPAPHPARPLRRGLRRHGPRALDPPRPQQRRDLRDPRRQPPAPARSDLSQRGR
jgi:hypothetical protein